jgi:hypothetical protein
LPQVPQLFLSVLVLVQVPLQFCLGEVHWVTQAPPVQTCVEVQALVHEPQCAWSPCRFTQSVPHWVSPVVQVVLQMPLVQA